MNHYCSTHGYNCPYYHNVNNALALKGASVMNQQQQQQRQQPQKQFLFSPKEINFIDQVLKVAGYKVSKLNPQTEEYKNMINDISNILKMISVKTKNQNQSSLKGASLDNKFQSLVNIRNMFGLGNNNNVRNNNNQLKGASQNNNNNICSKKQSLINISEHFGLT